MGPGQRATRRNLDGRQDASPRPVRPRLPQELVAMVGFEDHCKNGVDGDVRPSRVLVPRQESLSALVRVEGGWGEGSPVPFHQDL